MIKLWEEFYYFSGSPDDIGMVIPFTFDLWVLPNARSIQELPPPPPPANCCNAWKPSTFYTAPESLGFWTLSIIQYSKRQRTECFGNWVVSILPSCLSFKNTRQWTKSRNTVILIIRTLQNLILHSVFLKTNATHDTNAFHTLEP
jgi:hypothetical protein